MKFLTIGLISFTTTPIHSFTFAGSNKHLEMNITCKPWIITLAFVALLHLTATAQADKRTAKEPNTIFPKGELGPEENFTGKAWNIGLVPSDSLYNTLVGNVYFEPGARSNWHTHPAGQILIITDGIGYHQIKGEPRQTLKKGDVVKCPPSVEHWHGASPDTGLQQLYIIPNTEKGIVKWLQPVTDREYKATK